MLFRCLIKKEKGGMEMELILFLVLMVVGHMLMMFVMPGMHGGHNHKEHSHTKNNSKDMEALEEENKQLKEDLNILKSNSNRNEW